MMRAGWFLVVLGALLAAAAAVCGCAEFNWQPHTPVSPTAVPMVIYSHESLEECHKEHLEEAAELWNQAARRRYGHLPDDFQLVIFDRDPIPERPPLPGTAIAIARNFKPPQVGETNSFNGPLGLRKNGIISLRKSCFLGLRNATHEVGHLLGRRHVEDPYSVMYPVILNEPWDILPEDAVNLLVETTGPLF